MHVATGTGSRIHIMCISASVCFMSQNGNGEPQVPNYTVFIVAAITLTAGSEDVKSIYIMCILVSCHSQIQRQSRRDPQVPICTVFIVTAITLTAGSEDLKSIYIMCVLVSCHSQTQWQLGTPKSPFALCL